MQLLLQLLLFLFLLFFLSALLGLFLCLWFLENYGSLGCFLSGSLGCHFAFLLRTGMETYCRGREKFVKKIGTGILLTFGSEHTRSECGLFHFFLFFGVIGLLRFGRCGCCLCFLLLRFYLGLGGLHGLRLGRLSGCRFLSRCYRRCRRCFSHGCRCCFFHRSCLCLHFSHAGAFASSLLLGCRCRCGIIRFGLCCFLCRRRCFWLCFFCCPLGCRLLFVARCFFICFRFFLSSPFCLSVSRFVLRRHLCLMVDDSVCQRFQRFGIRLLYAEFFGDCAQFVLRHSVQF